MTRTLTASDRENGGVTRVGVEICAPADALIAESPKFDLHAGSRRGKRGELERLRECILLRRRRSAVGDFGEASGDRLRRALGFGKLDARRLLDVGHGERSNLLSGVQRMGVNEVGGAF